MFFFSLRNLLCFESYLTHYLQAANLIPDLKMWSRTSSDLVKKYQSATGNLHNDNVLSLELFLITGIK
jgi:hypothetical protein